MIEIRQKTKDKSIACLQLFTPVFKRIATIALTATILSCDNEAIEDIIMVYEPIELLKKEKMQEVFGTYNSKDAIWITSHSLAVNREYDFEKAFSLADIGPVIARMERIRENKNLAKEIERTPRTNVKRAFRTSMSKCLKQTSTISRNKISKKKRTYRLYGMLFGKVRSRLQVVLDVLEQDEDRRSHTEDNGETRMMYITRSIKMEGKSSWQERNWSLLREKMTNRLLDGM